MNIEHQLNQGWLQLPISQTDLEGRATRTTFVGIIETEFRKVSEQVPALKILKAIESTLFAIFKKFNVAGLKVKKLAELKDTLLLKLLSRELTLNPEVAA